MDSKSPAFPPPPGDNEKYELVKYKILVVRYFGTKL